MESKLKDREEKTREIQEGQRENRQATTSKARKEHGSWFGRTLERAGEDNVIESRKKRRENGRFGFILNMRVNREAF